MTLPAIAAMSDISARLRAMGADSLAERLEYLASDEDMEPGESPATLESARGFLAFYASVTSDSKVGLACSPEGWLVGEWRWFPDRRSLGVWFIDADTALFSGTDKTGGLVNIKERNVIIECSKATQALAQEGVICLAQQTTAERDLGPEHNVGRYCTPRNIVNGATSYAVFLLRTGENFLSTNWLKYFHSTDRQIQLSGIRQALTDKGFRISPNGGFAVLNVGYSTGQAGESRLQFRLLGQASAPSHAGIFGYQAGDADTAIMLAHSVRGLHPLPSSGYYSAIEVNRHEIPPPELPVMTLPAIAAMSDISARLRAMGAETLAERLEYLASDEDLEPGESPATLDSARGFLAFYASVVSDSKVGLACSPEGWLVGEWRWFPDRRSLGVWFLDDERVMFSALRPDGEFVKLENRSNITERSILIRKLVQEGVFS